jgi:hypothetical protein
MAGKCGIALQKSIALGVATAKTVIQLVAAANHPIDLTEISVGFDATDSTFEAVEVELVRQTTAGTATALTIVKANDSDADTFDTTAQHSATVEPTTTDVLRIWRIHPQTGYAYQLSTAAPIHVGAADRVALRITSANAVNVDAYMTFEE